MLKFSSIYLAGALLVSGVPLQAQTVSPAPTFLAAPMVGAPGLRREAGTWLFNESIFVAPGANRTTPGASPFMPNLRRDKKNKLPLFMPASAGAPLQWATLPLPDLRQLSASGFDFGALQTQLSAQANAARAAGQLYVGWSLSSGLSPEAPPLDSTAVGLLIKRLRIVLNAVSPDGALILEVDTVANPSQALADLDAAAANCDAMLLRVDPDQNSALWPLKMARREAEEQPNFDLPIFVMPINGALKPVEPTTFDRQLLKFWMGGATGFVLADAPVPTWAGAVTRNPGLFAGAVTLEDAAVLPSSNPHTQETVAQLRAAGRVPLVGRIPLENAPNPRGESVLTVLDAQTSLETLSALDKAARAGNSIYLEGLPNLQNKAIFDKISDMTNAKLEILTEPRAEVLTLTDPWLFGDARAREIAVTQRVKWELKTSLAAQARKKKGEDVLEAISVAKLANDANGLLVAPLGKGRILWLAHTPLHALGSESAERDYYSAIAGALQGGLARLSFQTPELAAQDGSKVTLALRASKTGTPIVALFNDNARDVAVSLSARSDAPVALDLQTGREIATSVVGYSSNLAVTVPARGFAWFTFGATSIALNKERLAPRPKAKTR